MPKRKATKSKSRKSTRDKKALARRRRLQRQGGVVTLL